MDNKKIVRVLNRDGGSVGYTIPDLNNLHRNFETGEEKKLSVEELQKLSYIPGGEYILRNCLLIKDSEVVEELLGEVEPEYYYTKNEIKTLLTSGSLDQLLDCLDFSPSGVVDIVKDMAIKMNINDINKREAIFEKTGLNVTKAIEINKETEKVEEQVPQKRRTKAVSTENTIGNFRRANPVK